MSTRRLYYEDAFLKDFSARVVHCEELPPDLAAGIAGTAWGLLLDRTAFYPTSGGQPHDLGKIGDANVLDVRDEGEEILHVVDRRPSEPDVDCCIHWPRRFDHMQQHTGQHLLSAMFQERYGRPTVSFHLGSEVCTIDLRGPEPAGEVLEGAERAANQVIFENRPVTIRYGTADQLAQLGVRKEVAREGILRAIEIEGVELQPCGGTHVKSTGQIGIVLTRRCTKIRQDWRVEFMCGGRAERAARSDFQRLRQAAEKLSCAPEDIVSSASRALSERDANFKKIRVLLEQLAGAEAALALQAAGVDRNEVRIVSRVFEDVASEYLGFFGTAVAKTEKAVALIAMADGGDLLFAQNPSVGKDMNALLKQALEKLGGQGGGTRDFARGKLTNASQVKSALALAREKLPQS
ncbi:MAG TPA: DHHA1 domain-containing protein [Candidatus Acidoferrum sp.]|nr:DHHA1 domain-containing protein [Candidatus Acidoferrum sp.]